MPTTQKILPHLSLIQDFYEDSRICGIISLLYKKHSAWQDGYSREYVDWIQFLLPYLHFLASIKLDFQKVLNLNKDDVKNIAKIYLSKLNDVLEARNTNLKFEINDETDISLLLEQMLKLKPRITDVQKIRDGRFYYEIGLLSFLIHLLQSDSSEKFTFMKICLLSSLYIGKIFF